MNVLIGLKSWFYLITIRLRDRIFHKQIVNEAQLIWLSLEENEGE